MRKARYIVNFAQHLADCEYNYRRLRRLMPGWRQNSNSGVSSIAYPQWHYLMGEAHPWQSRLELSIRDVAKYTTTVHIRLESLLQKQLTWIKNDQSNGQIARMPQPCDQGADTLEDSSELSCQLDVRLYHDASLAEVISCDQYRRFAVRHEYPNKYMHQTDEKAQVNRFLGELLDDCLRDGRVEQQFNFAANGSFVP